MVILMCVISSALSGKTSFLSRTVTFSLKCLHIMSLLLLANITLSKLTTTANGLLL